MMVAQDVVGDTEVAVIEETEMAETDLIAEGVLGSATAFVTQGVAVTGTNADSHTMEPATPNMVRTNNREGIMGEDSDVLLAVMDTEGLREDMACAEEVPEEESVIPGVTLAAVDTGMTADFHTTNDLLKLYVFYHFAESFSESTWRSTKPTLCFHFQE